MSSLDEMFQNAGTPPRAEETPTVLTHFEDDRVDEYYWLRDKDSPKVIELLSQENSYAKSVTSELKVLEEELFTEMKNRIKESDLSVAVRKKNYYYLSKTEEGKQYPIHVRKRVGSETEEILLDENLEA
ncbi:MAG: oligopeptidase B, partial [Actinomycetota bacterium]|nr:oligopeptidase B [Actinomycetota bacterium]